METDPIDFWNSQVNLMIKQKIDINLIKTAVEKGEVFNLILSKKQMSVFVEHTKDLPIYEILFIENHPGRPLLKGIFNIIYTSIFHKEIYELISYFYKNQRILMCEVGELNEVYSLKFIPKN